MIVKVRNDSSWSYFECKVIHSKYEAFGAFKSKGDNAVIRKIDCGRDWVMLLERKELKDDVVVKILSLETLKSHLRTIITDRVCYVLNSEGKTIDKI